MFSGFPSNFSFDNKSLKKYNNLFKNVFKVRMIGCASLSILNIALGKGEIYYENNIKLWDVAAALAIIKSRSGAFKILKQDKNMNLELGKWIASEGFGGVFPWAANYDSIEYNNSLVEWLYRGLIA